MYSPPLLFATLRCDYPLFLYTISIYLVNIQAPLCSSRTMTRWGQEGCVKDYIFYCLSFLYYDSHPQQLLCGAFPWIGIWNICKWHDMEYILCLMKHRWNFNFKLVELNVFPSPWSIASNEYIFNNRIRSGPDTDTVSFRMSRLHEEADYRQQQHHQLTGFNSIASPLFILSPFCSGKIRFHQLLLLRHTDSSSYTIYIQIPFGRIDPQVAALNYFQKGHCSLPFYTTYRYVVHIYI